MKSIFAKSMLSIFMACLFVVNSETITLADQEDLVYIKDTELNVGRVIPNKLKKDVFSGENEYGSLNTFESEKKKSR